MSVISAFENAKHVNREKIFVVTKNECPFCSYLKEELETLELEYTVYNTVSEEERSDIKAYTSRSTFPIIYIGKELIGGFSEFMSLRISGQLSKHLSTIGLSIKDEF